METTQKEPKVPKDALQQIARLEASLARVRAEYDKLKIASAKRNAREAKLSALVRNLVPLSEYLAALETKLPQAQLALLDVANGHVPPVNDLFAAAEVLRKFAQRARRLASDLTPEEPPAPAE